MKIIGSDSPEMKGIFETLDKVLNMIKSEKANAGLKLNDVYYLTNRDLIEKLHISARTLQEYRTKGKLDYFLFGGKVLYKASDVYDLLEANYVKGFNIK